MSLGVPCNHIISLTYDYANLSIHQVSCMGWKWANLVSLSTMTKIAFFLEAERGNPMMKSIEIESHFQVGTSSSPNCPTGRWCSALTFWQVKHLSIYSTIFLFTLSHQKYCFKSGNIFVPSGCTKYGLLWASINVFSFSYALSGAHNRVWNLNVPSSSTTIPGDFPFSKVCLIFYSLIHVKPTLHPYAQELPTYVVA